MTTPSQSSTDGNRPSLHLDADLVVDGYKLIQLLGKGGFGEVWKAHAADGIFVALKFIAIDEKAAAVEKRSLDLIKNTRHPNLVALFRAWKRDRYLVLAMELGDRTLLARLEEAQEQGHAGIPRDELLEYMREAAKGIDFLNQQKVQHRDIKPQNLLLVGGGVKVADFGLAKLMEHTISQHSGSMTPAYAAPEFLKNQTSPFSDQYSLAVSYCQLRGGRLPFGGNAAQMVTGHLMLPPDLTMLPAAERPAVARALAKEPNDRWPSCRAFVDAVEAAAAAGKQRDKRPVAPPIAPAADTTPAGIPSSQTVPTIPEATVAAGDRRLLPRLGLVAAGLLLIMIALALSGNRAGDGKGKRKLAKQQPAQLKAPFDAAQAQKLQLEWSAYLDLNVEEALDLGGGLKMTFVLIPPGIFMMGSPDAELKLEGDHKAYDDEVPQHEVTITRPFYLGKYEVLQVEYVRVTGKANPSYFSASGAGKDKVGADTSRFPVEQINHDEAAEFCTLLQTKLGPKWGKARLPSEAMWEYACRAGTQTRWHVGDILTARDANSRTTNLSCTRAVGDGTANAFGLYDMHGNVWEWCSDWKETYENRQQTDPEGPQNGSDRVYRGGGWLISARRCRSANRDGFAPSFRYGNLGFRVALVPSGK